MAVILPGNRAVADGRVPGRRPQVPGAFVRLCAWGLLLAMPLAAPARPMDGAVSLRVAPHGAADHRTVQAAIDAAVARTLPATIHIAAGTYREVLDIPLQAPPIELRGEGAARTVIVFDNHASRIAPATGQPYGTSGSATVFVHGNDFRAQHLTFANDAGPVGQAVALRLSGTRAAFRDVHLRGHQDTLYLQGQDTLAWFGDCHIEGTVDFIFGAGTALFENCRVHSLGDGYVTAAATPEGRRFGYVFKHCELTADSAVTQVYLGRPWRPYARVAVLESALGAHIAPAGWHDWNQPERRSTAAYVEYANTGPGAGREARVPWSRALEAEEAAGYTRGEILGDWRPFE